MMPPWLMSGRATAMEERIIITNLGHLWTPRDVATITHLLVPREDKKGAGEEESERGRQTTW